MRELEAVLVAFRELTRCDAAVWTAAEGDGHLVSVATSNLRLAKPETVPDSNARTPLSVNGGTMLVAAVPGVKRTWVAVTPCDGPAAVDPQMRMLLPFVSQVLRGSQEVEHAAMELAERYEEINLLYTIGEILGRTVTLEDAAATILTEISETVGARHASILVHEAGTDTLHVVAAIPPAARGAPTIRVDDPGCVSARVFRTQHPLTVEAGDMECEAERPYRRGEMLSVPIMWTTPSGGEPLGVVNLSDRRSKQPYSAGDQKLVAAIATQIGTAIQNARLVRASIDQQRLLQEMSLAHDLQMKLLPKTTIVAPEAEVAARVVPAESVGGDFYHLFRMPRNRDRRDDRRRLGPRLSRGAHHGAGDERVGDPRAEHRQSRRNARRLFGSLREELSSTEMYISVFFGVIDHGAAKLRYANTGHPHAFVVSQEGTITRLSAVHAADGHDWMSLGVTASIPWSKGSDFSFFSPTESSIRGTPQDERLGEDACSSDSSAIARNSTTEIVDAVFKLLEKHSGEIPSPDDLTLVVLRS